jgi:hypothetical protein
LKFDILTRRIELFVRSGEMVSFLFTVISILILFPILYILPIGFTVRGKLMIVIVTFLIVTLGLLATEIIPFWQMILVEVLIVGIATYLLDKNLASLLYASKVDDFEVFEEEDRTKSILEGLSETYSHIASSDKVNKPLITLEQEEYEAVHNPKNVIEYEKSDVELEEIEVSSTFDSYEEVAVAVQDENISNTVIVNDKQIEDVGYLGEIEKYLSTETMADQEDVVIPDENPMSISEADISDLEIQIIEAIASLDKEISVEEHTSEFVEVNNEDFSELIIEDNSFEIVGLTTKEQEVLNLFSVKLHDLNEILNEDQVEAIPEVKEEFFIDSKEVESEKDSIKIDFNFAEDDDEDFWRMLQEDDDEDKKESKTTDKLERMWEKTGLAK